MKKETETKQKKNQRFNDSSTDPDRAIKIIYCLSSNHGGFQLLDLIITELKSHMIC